MSCKGLRLAWRKRLSCTPKPTVLPCDRGTFAKLYRGNRFFGRIFFTNAEEACANGGQHAANHFVDAGKTAEPFYMQAMSVFAYSVFYAYLYSLNLNSLGRMEEHLTVYRASAGSGKTFTLAVEYISLLVKDPRELSAHTCRNLHEQGYAGNEDAHSVATLRHCPFAAVVGAVFQQGEREDEYARMP